MNHLASSVAYSPLLRAGTGQLAPHIVGISVPVLMFGSTIATRSIDPSRFSLLYCFYSSCIVAWLG